MAPKNKDSSDSSKVVQPLVKGGKRFVLPEIKQEVESKYAQKSEIEQLKKKKAKEEQEKYELRLHKEKAEYALLASEYGLDILESALRGETSYTLDGVTGPRLSIELAFRDRGFDVYRHEYDYSVDELDENSQKRYFHYHPDIIEKINLNIPSQAKQKEFRIHLLNQLFQIKRAVKIHPDLRIHSSKHFEYLQVMDDLFSEAGFFQDSRLEWLVELANSISMLPYHHEAGAIKEVVGIVIEMSKDISIVKPDKQQFSRFEIDWERGCPSSNLIKDCIEATFLNWLSSEFGKIFIKEIFTKIEEANLKGKSNLTIQAKLTDIEEYFWEEDSDGDGEDDEGGCEEKILVPALRILSSNIPFDVSHLLTMFSILGYSIESNTDSSGDSTLTFGWN
jgi:hypothetical protein